MNIEKIRCLHIFLCLVVTGLEIPQTILSRVKQELSEQKVPEETQNRVLKVMKSIEGLGKYSCLKIIRREGGKGMKHCNVMKESRFNFHI